MNARRRSRDRTQIDNSTVASKPPERIQKSLAHAGYGSRREIEKWIEQGLVKINGQVAKLGDRVSESDGVVLKGKKINLAKRLNIETRVLIYHKPSGELVTRRDPEGRAVIFTQLPKLKSGRWIAVGRLDINTQGLLLVTNNGELANGLMHPSRQIEREYAVRVFGEVSDEILEHLKSGVDLEDGPARFDAINFVGGEGLNTWYRVIATQGRHRIVRRLWESQGLMVSRLMRVRYGPVVLPENLKARTFHELNQKEMAALFESIGMNGQIKQPKRRKQKGSPGR